MKKLSEIQHESESIVEDNLVNEMEKSFTQEAMEETHEAIEETRIEEEPLMI